MSYQILRKIYILPIRLYQKTFSGDHGLVKVFFPYGVCCFYPSCSEYTAQAILKYGIFYGSYKGMRRIMRCHPFSKGGIDHP